MHNNLIILAGGASSRMKKQCLSKTLSEEEIEQANKRSKGLISVGPNGRPLIDYLLYNAKQAGYKKIFLLIGENGALFREFYGKHTKNNDFHGLSISFAVQYIPKNRVKPFGTADALLQVVKQYPQLNTQSYTVCNSDNLYSVNALFSLRKCNSPNAFISYDRDGFDFPVGRIQRFALAKLNAKNQLTDIIEKPPLGYLEKFRDASGKLRVSMNIFKCAGIKLYLHLKNCPVHPETHEKELPTVLLNMMKEFPNSVLGIPYSEHVPDLNEKDDIEAVKEYLKEHYGTLEWNDKTETCATNMP